MHAHLYRSLLLDRSCVIATRRRNAIIARFRSGPEAKIVISATITFGLDVEVSEGVEPRPSQCHEGHL